MSAEPYDPNNIFAKILRGELPCQKVYEDDSVLAFMDIMPRSDGHTLVISKSPCRNILDISPEALAGLFRGAQIVAKAAKAAFDADGITVLQSSESASGQVVFHIHVHVMPRWEGVKLRPHTGEMAQKDVLAAQAEKIRTHL